MCSVKPTKLSIVAAFFFELIGQLPLYARIKVTERIGGLLGGTSRKISNLARDRRGQNNAPKIEIKSSMI